MLSKSIKQRAAWAFPRMFTTPWWGLKSRYDLSENPARILEKLVPRSLPSTSLAPPAVKVPP